VAATEGREAEVLRVDAGSERSLAWLLFGRLVLALLSLGIAMGLDALGREISAEARRGLYWTVALAFLATAITGALSARVRRPARFAVAQIGADVAIVSGLVYFSGGGESVFSFLYVFVTVYAALLFERRVALLAASLGAVSYGGLLLGVSEGWLPDHGTLGGIPHTTLAAIWGVQIAAMFLVGALASVLSSEVRVTGAALVRRTSDLHRLEELHQQTVESLTSGLLTTDIDGRITSFNPEAVRLTGAAVHEALGEHVDRIIPGSHQLLGEAASGVERRGIPRSRIEYRNRRGDELYLGLAGSLLRAADGSQRGYILIFQDVTRVVDMELELKRSERMAAVGEMAAHMAHEIRNPLAAVSGAVQVLQGSADGGEGESGRLMDIVVREAQRLDGLLSDFLLYARPGPTRRERLRLDELVLDVSELLAQAIPEGIRVELDLEEGLEVFADPAQLRQVLWNLCLNASQAMGDEGRLGLRLASRAGAAAQGPGGDRRSDAEAGTCVRDADVGAVEIEVSDTGPGIAPADQERIFEPFFTTRKGGSGLGLPMVHRVVESHGGSVLLLSQLGRGTSFRIRLPRRAEGE